MSKSNHDKGIIKSDAAKFEKIIKKLKNRVDELSAQNYQLKYLIDNLPGDIYWKNKNGSWAGINKRCIQSLQRMGFIKKNNASEVIGKTDYQLFGKKTADIYRQTDLEVMDKAAEITREEVTQLLSGEILTLLSTKKPLCDEKDDIVGIVGNTIDITERKKMEDDLLQAKEAAEIANQAKSEFIRNMEHQLRTPFCGVYSMVELLAGNEKDPERKELLEITYSSAREFLDLLNDIIEVSRNQLETPAIIYKKFDLKKLIENIITMEQAAATFKHLTLKYKYPKTIPTIWIGDPNRIQRTLMNLLSNAIKFTEKGKITVNIKLAKKIDDKHFIIQLIVSDTGIGIPEDKQAFIYEKFYRLHPANQNKYTGAGLGLYIVKQHIEEIGGEIDVVSTPKKGTTFTCSFPLTRPLLDEIIYLD